MSKTPIISTLITALLLVGCGTETQEELQVANLPHQVVDIKPKALRGFDEPESEEYLNYMKIYNLNSPSFNFQKSNGAWSANYTGSWSGKKAYYIDIDKNNQTGYFNEWSPKVGAEYILEEGVLFKFTGTDGTKEWSWDVISYEGIEGFDHNVGSILAYCITLNDDWSYRNFVGYYDTNIPYKETDAQLAKDEGESNSHGAFYTASDNEDFYIRAFNKNYKHKEATRYYTYEFTINGTNYSIEGDILFDSSKNKINDTLLYELHDRYSIVVIPKEFLVSGDIKLKKAVIRDGSWGVLNSYKYEENGGGDKVTRQELDRMIADNEDYSQVDVSGITDMSELFYESKVKYDITGWDVSNVTTMRRMFQSTVFNQPIGDWDVSNVATMDFMFEYTPFNQPIEAWDVSKVISMNRMFHGAKSFNHPIGNWDVSKVTDMNGMFQSTTFNQPIGNWNVSKVTNMHGMFYDTAFNQPIGNWNVSKVITMNWMFGATYSFNQPIGNWNVSRVTDMSGMFATAKSFNQPIGNWNVSNVTDFSSFNYQNNIYSALEDKNIPAKFR